MGFWTPPTDKIGLSEGRGGKSIPMVALFEYDRHGFEGYLGNVGEDGWAMAYRKYRNNYVRAEIIAKTRRERLWRGEFQPPCEWQGRTK
jgi:hypothetical protein